jgi:hypothetical protein
MLRLEETPSFREVIQRLASEVQGGPEHGAYHLLRGQDRRDGAGLHPRGAGQLLEYAH